jgi:hypothetical protein
MATVDHTKPKTEPKYSKSTPNLAGQRFHRLFVISFAGRTKNHKMAWNCICECGTRTVTTANELTHKNGPRSCGCLRRERSKERTTVHGFSGMPEYKTWKDMIDRCYSENCIAYKYYGGRGISVCERWRQSFSDFLEDMGNRPCGHTIDRIDNDGNYEPANCRWATRREQASNRRKAVPRAEIVIEFNGMQKTVSEWSEYTGVKVGTISCRRSRGYPIEQVLHSGKLPRKVRG